MNVNIVREVLEKLENEAEINRSQPYSEGLRRAKEIVEKEIPETYQPSKDSELILDFKKGLDNISINYITYHSEVRRAQVMSVLEAQNNFILHSVDLLHMLLGSVRPPMRRVVARPSEAERQATKDEERFCP